LAWVAVAVLARRAVVSSSMEVSWWSRWWNWARQSSPGWWR